MLLRQRRARLRGLHASVLPRVLFEQRASLGTSPQPSNDFDTQKRPPNFWNDVGNQKQWFNQVGLKLGFKEFSDWYGATKYTLRQMGGTGLLAHYQSIGEALQTVYPEYAWKLDAFKRIAPRVPARQWQQPENLTAALQAAANRLGITQPEDWYSVAISDLKEVGMPANFTRGKHVKLLKEVYPQHKWDTVLLLRGKYAQQYRLGKAVASLFPGEEVHRSVRKEGGVINPETGSPMELDIFLPALQLAFEYQDIRYYKEAGRIFQPVQFFRNRDKRKQQLALNKGISLIIVPCWWDGKTDSLVATIRESRPELLTNEPKGTMIPLDIPIELAEQLEKSALPHIEGIGEPATACFFTGAKTNPIGWWLFEKYDGVRGFWNPSKKCFYSRNGTQLNIPESIVATMPNDVFLDGELWFGRSNFREAAKLSSNMQSESIDWTKLKYMVFDAPNHPGSYAERYKYLEERLGRGSSGIIEVAPMVVCEGNTHRETRYQDIVDGGGEGIILRDPKAAYQAGRSPGYLKHKKFRDAEARVERILDNNQWECILPNGITFTAMAETTEFLKRWQPRVGDVVSFKYRGYLMGSKKPKAPSIYRVRSDLTWDDVVLNFREKKVKPTTGLSHKQEATRRKSRGYWRSPTRLRDFFCKFAEEAGFEPSNTERWNAVTSKQIRAKGGSTIVSKGTLRKALRKAFPELAFRFKEARGSKPRNYWKTTEHWREFFDSFAREAGLDPLNPENWYSVKADRLLAVTGGYAIQEASGGLRKAIEKAYPEVRFDLWQPKDASQTVATCRQFFDDVAKELHMDPLDSVTWTRIGISQLRHRKGGEAIKRKYGGFRNALHAAYPKLALPKGHAAPVAL